MAGKIAHSIKCLPYMCKDLSSNPRTHLKEKNSDVAECTNNPSTGEVDIGASLELTGQLS